MRLRSRLVTALLALAGVGAIGVHVLRPKPARLVTPGPGDADTVIVNAMRAARLQMSVADQYDRRAPAVGVHFRRLTGTVPVSHSGIVTCPLTEDAAVRATLGPLTREFVLRCRPVKWVEAVSSLNLVAGDSARPLHFVARGPDGARVTELRGDVTIEDGRVAQLVGPAVRPIRAGRTVAGVTAGTATANILILVHRLVTTFVGNPRDDDLLAMPVRLARGDTIELPTPKAAFWLTYLPRDPDDAPPTIELRGSGGCSNGDGVRAKRVEVGEYTRYCITGDGATIRLAHGVAGADTVKGTIALQLAWR
jgi:hypothetical protein